jgi:transposase-like protein
VNLRVGRTRAGGSATAPLGRYARRRPELDAAITQARGTATALHGAPDAERGGARPAAPSEREFADGTQYFAFPEEHWVRIRSTNGLERLHGEIKRRTRAVGAFPDRASALRLITAVAMQATSIWRDRIYLDMTLLDHYATAA